MRVQLWGVRGSICSPMNNEEYTDKITRIITHAIDSGLGKDEIDKILASLPDDLRHVYGGNTTCASVTSKSGNIYVLDCGTGIRELGYELMKGDCGSGKGTVNILLTHNHWDHIQGLPFFTPIYIRGNVIHFHSPYKSQEALLQGQMKAPYFPAAFKTTPSEKHFHYIDPKKNKSYQLEEDLFVDIYPLKHPNGCYAYRFKQDGKTFIFATDCEFTGESLELGGPEMDFFKNADLLVLDAQYTLDESFLKIDWGHTSYTMAVNCGVRWNVKNLIMTHHEPAYSDAKLHENFLAAQEHCKYNDSDNLNIIMAREGLTFSI